MTSSSDQGPVRLSKRLEAFRARIVEDRDGEPLPTEDEHPPKTAAELRRERMLELIELQLPVDVRHASIGALPQTPAGKAARSWAISPDGRNCVHLGPTGRGKTWASAAQARALAGRHGIYVRWLTTKQMFAGLRPDGGLDMDRIVRADVLVLDELGADVLTEWEHGILGQVVDARVSNHRPIITTSNLTAEELADVLDERIWSRLMLGRAEAPTVPIRWGGPDRRRTG